MKTADIIPGVEYVTKRGSIFVLSTTTKYVWSYSDRQVGIDLDVLTRLMEAAGVTLDAKVEA